MDDCIFCMIAAGKIPSARVYEDEYVYAFRDNDPKAPVHVLIVPKTHFNNILEADGETVKHLFDAVKKIAVGEGVDKTGFRAVINTGRDGGQSVEHLHIHLLGQRELGWPPG